MTIERQDITESFYAGNSKRIRVTVRDEDGNLKNLSQSEITYVLFDRSNPENIHIRKSSANGNAEIEIISLGICDIKLNPVDSTNLYGTYMHHANVVDENGDEETVFSGKVEIHKAPARRYRKLSVAAYLNGQAPS